MVRASRNVSNLRRAPVRPPEQVDRVPQGPGPTGELEYSTVYTGRPRRPESLEEWYQRRIAALLQFRHMPAVAAVIALLEAGQGADVKAVGRQLDDWQRNGVLTALGELANAARASYPPAAGQVAQLERAWRRVWGDRPALPPRLREVKREPRARVVTGAEKPPSAGQLAAAWGSPLGSA